MTKQLARSQRQACNDYNTARNSVRNWGDGMSKPLDRRTFLRGSAVAAGSALTCTAMVRTAAGEVVPRIEAPLVDKLVIRVVVDGAHDIFIPEQKLPDIAVAQARLQGGGKYRRTLQSEWGLSL